MSTRPLDWFFSVLRHAPLMSDPGPAEAALRRRPGVRLARNPLQRALYLIVGTISLGLAALGVFIRGLLPTTPFLLLAAYCYGRSSERMYRWIYTHRIFGPILIDWEDHRSLSPRTKTIAVSSVWIGIAFSILVLHFTAPVARQGYLQALLVLIATGVSVFLSTRPTTHQQHPGTYLITGPSRRAKSFALGVLWVGLIIAAAILILQTQLAHPILVLLAAIGLLLSPLVATARSGPLPPRRRRSTQDEAHRREEPHSDAMSTTE
jgi:uncharacterized protein